MNCVLDSFSKCCNQSYVVISLSRKSKRCDGDIYLQGRADNKDLLEVLKSYGNEKDITDFLSEEYTVKHRVFRHYTFELEGSYLKFYYKARFVKELKVHYEAVDVLNVIFNLQSVVESKTSITGTVKRTYLNKIDRKNGRFYYQESKTYIWTKCSYKVICKEFVRPRRMSRYFRSF